MMFDKYANCVCLVQSFNMIKVFFFCLFEILSENFELALEKISKVLFFLEKTLD